MLNQTIRSKVDTLWDRFFAGGIANPLAAIEQISYLFFMRRLDEADRKRVEDSEWLGQTYETVFAGTFRDRSGETRQNEELRWSRFRHLPADELLEHVRDLVFPFIKKLGGEDHLFAKHMKDAVFLIPKPSLLVESIGILDDIYAEIERQQTEQGQTFHDVQGDLYEYLLSEISSAGKNGQFRTPRHIIQMICAVVDPKLGDEICDPACGTGGFLLGAHQHILTKHTSPERRQVDENGLERGLAADLLTDDRQWEVLRERTFHGYDFDTSMVRIGLMNLMLHGVDRPKLDYKDTLGKKFTEAECYDVVLANPPFKGSIDKGDINDELKLPTTKTELLFVERIMRLLRLGGRAGVIVPDGVLFGGSKAHQKLRERLIKECELQGVISMPSGVFKPYAGVSTAVLVFVKGGTTEHVWFYDMTADGYSLDDKRNRIAENDIPDVLARWKSRSPAKDTNRKAKAFFVPVKEIVDNKYDLSINRYKEVDHAEAVYEAPKEILKRLRGLEDEIRADLDELERLLG